MFTLKKKKKNIGKKRELKKNKFQNLQLIRIKKINYHILLPYNFHIFYFFKP